LRTFFWGFFFIFEILPSIALSSLCNKSSVPQICVNPHGPNDLAQELREIFLCGKTLVTLALCIENIFDNVEDTDIYSDTKHHATNRNELVAYKVKSLTTSMHKISEHSFHNPFFKLKSICSISPKIKIGH